MEKQELLGRVRAGFADLARRLEGLDDAALEQSCRAEGWTRREVLAHLAAWYEVSAERLELIGRGRADAIQWVAEDVDEWNARFFARDRELSPARVRERLGQTQRAVLAALEALPVQAFNDPRARAPIERWLPACTYEHEREHHADLGEEM